VIGKPAWASEKKFATFAHRKANEDELDKLIEEWTCQYPAGEVMHRMQVAGIAAGVVAGATDRNVDPQLQYRSHFVTLDHVEIGLHHYETPSWRLSATPGEVRLASPCLGEHNEYVCKKILGMPDDEFVQLLNEGVLE
jgi:crotonobetainyl-CoA:carnitine CoA-transferase CaiB-like acyl-CoA transferase